MAHVQPGRECRPSRAEHDGIGILRAERRMGVAILVAPARPEQQLPALPAAAVADHDEGVAQEAKRQLAAARAMQVGRGEADPPLSRPEAAPGVVERDELELQNARHPYEPVARLEPPEQLAAPHEAAVVEPAQRPVASHRDERPLARLHQLLRGERRRAAGTFGGEPPRQDELLERVDVRSEEHTSELQSPCNLVCRLLLEKKKIHIARPGYNDNLDALPGAPGTI